MSIRAQIEEIHDRDLIYARAGAVHVESIVETQYPHVNISTLVDCLTDQLFDWSAATDDYAAVDAAIRKATTR